MAKRKRKRRRKSRRIQLPVDMTKRLTSRGALRAGAWLLGVAGLITAWGLGVPRLRAYASDHQRADDVVVRFVNAPAWVGDDLQTMLVMTAGQHIGTDPLRRDDLVAARDALQMTGWFDDIGQVRRVRAGLVELEAKFAEPFAVIRDDGGDHLVDSRGRLMPKTFPTGSAEGFIVIAGARFERPERPGQHWEGADVVAAMNLLRLIQDRPWREQVVEVNIRRFMRESSVRLITDRGCTIVWGRAPGQESASEVPVEHKLSYLDYHHEHYGHIDRGFVTELDITGDVVIGR